MNFRSSDDSRVFITALQGGDTETVRRIPKSDLHNHWLYGAPIEAFERHCGHALVRAPERMDTIAEMVDWTRHALWPLFKSPRAYHEFALAASFEQAVADGVAVLEMNVDIGIAADLFPKDPDGLVRSIADAHALHAPTVLFRPELAIKGHAELPRDFFDACLGTGYFKSLDLYGVEDTGGSYADYRDLFMAAGRAGLKLKAHVGEFGTAQLVRETVEVLNLKAVQHGIAAAGSEEVLCWLADRGTRLNVCPTSNVALRRVSSLAQHPIRALFHAGIHVTVNSDDMAIFGQSVSDEYLNLFKAGVLTAPELDEIRMTGLE